MENLKGKKLSLIIAVAALVLIAVVVSVLCLPDGAGDPTATETSGTTDGTHTPVLSIILTGEEHISVEFGEEYTEQGAAAAVDGEAYDAVSITGYVDVQTVGEYVITYTAVYGEQTETVQRTVSVVDTKAPEIVLEYIEGYFTYPGFEYEDEGYSAFDNYDGDLTASVERTVDGETVTYTVTDSSGNVARAQRTITFCDVSEPILKLSGAREITITAGTKYSEPGYTATDYVDGDLTEQVKISGSVNIYLPGTYTLRYTVTNGQGNSTEQTRTVVVEGLVQPEAVDPGDKVVYLTFDDGPSKYTLDLLEVLEKYNVKATFFVVGSMSVGYLDEIADGGHAIGIHSMTHKYADIYCSEEAYFEDLYECQQLIYDKTGILTTLIRFPGGSSNTVSRSYSEGIMSRLVVAVEAQGFQYFDWNVNSNDAGGTTTSDGVFQNVISGIQKNNVSVVLQHDIKKYSVAAVEQIIQWGLANGYTFLPLDSSSPDCHSKVNN